MDTAPVDTSPVESAFRAALRAELAEPFSSLLARLLRVADGLSSGEPGRTFTLPAWTPEPATAEPEPEACAVIGCQQPRGALGYCKAHGRQRSQMIAAGRLHPQWVEEAAPHSVPNVIPPRRRRGEGRKAASPTVTARPTSEPRMWVRKKGAEASTPVPSAKAGGADAGAAVRVEPRPEEHQQIADTLGRWAREFKGRKPSS